MIIIGGNYEKKARAGAQRQQIFYKYCKEIKDRERYADEHARRIPVMKLNVYAVKDVKVAFLQPFFMQNDAVAIRAFTTAVNGDRGSSPIADYSQDHELWKLGTFEDSTGSLESHGAPDDKYPKWLCSGRDVKEVKANA